MAEFKLVLNDPKSGKALQKEVKDADAKAFIGLKIGSTVKGEVFDLPGYEFVITGGSDFAGFPMRFDVEGTQRKQILAVKGVGVINKLRKPNPKKKGWRTMNGMRLKKTVAGNTVYDRTAQINLKVTKQGRTPLFGEEEKPEETPTSPAEAAPKKAKPEHHKAEKAEKPTEENKEIKEEKPTEENEEITEDETVEELEEDIKRDEQDIAEIDEEESQVEKELKKVDED